MRILYSSMKWCMDVQNYHHEYPDMLSNFKAATFDEFVLQSGISKNNLIDEKKHVHFNPKLERLLNQRIVNLTI